MNRRLVFFLTMLCFAANLYAEELHIGTATADITPKLPVALMGQFNLRIADTIETPLTANVIALESRNGIRSLDIAIMVSCDVVEIPEMLLKMVRDEVHKKIPEIDAKKIFMTAIHTHTAPVLENGIQYSFRYQIPKKGVTQVEEYDIFFVQRVTEAIVKAWEKRRPGSVTWGLGHAAIAYNRRAVYSEAVPTPGYFSNGTSQMYGSTNLPEFINLEGMEDHDVRRPQEAHLARVLGALGDFSHRRELEVTLDLGERVTALGPRLRAFREFLEAATGGNETHARFDLSEVALEGGDDAGMALVSPRKRSGSATTVDSSKRTPANQWLTRRKRWGLKALRPAAAFSTSTLAKATTASASITSCSAS